jgi:hypothetical protein
MSGACAASATAAAASEPEPRRVRPEAGLSAGAACRSVAAAAATKLARARGTAALVPWWGDAGGGACCWGPEMLRSPSCPATPRAAGAAGAAFCASAAAAPRAPAAGAAGSAASPEPLLLLRPPRPDSERSRMLEAGCDRFSRAFDTASATADPWLPLYSASSACTTPLRSSCCWSWRRAVRHMTRCSRGLRSSEGPACRRCSSAAKPGWSAKIAPRPASSAAHTATRQCAAASCTPGSALASSRRSSAGAACAAGTARAEARSWHISLPSSAASAHCAEPGTPGAARSRRDRTAAGGAGERAARMARSVSAPVAMLPPCGCWKSACMWRACQLLHGAPMALRAPAHPAPASCQRPGSPLPCAPARVRRPCGPSRCRAPAGQAAGRRRRWRRGPWGGGRGGGRRARL